MHFWIVCVSVILLHAFVGGFDTVFTPYCKHQSLTLTLNQWHAAHVSVHIGSCFTAFIHAALTLNCGLLNYEACASFVQF